MKNYILPFVVSVAMASCSLDKEPISDFSELRQESSSAVSYTTRAELKPAYDAMYTFIKGNGQEFWMLDFMVCTETRSDNAYAGGTNLELLENEKNTLSSINKNNLRDWKGYLNGVARANIVLANIDAITDIDDSERKRWKAEAQILRAWMYFDMVRLWGEVPLSPAINLPPITSENINKLYPILYPERRNTVIEVYTDIIANLEAAAQNAPEVNSSNKFLFTKGVANALLAKVYAEKPMRDYTKTIQYADAVIASGYSLLPNYADLFQLNDTKTDIKLRNSSESIFEITYEGGGTWVAGLFGLNHTNPKDAISWARWVAPSRDLIAAFDAEGDVVRRENSIVYSPTNHTTYYPDKTSYPHLYKIRSSSSSVIKIRLADILLIKAEAAVALGDITTAASLVNQVRNRVNLPNIPNNLSQTDMQAAVLKERRLELAFEGQRWFDLLRSDKAIEIMNGLNSRDSGRLQMRSLTQNTMISPVPNEEKDKNPRLGQNQGY
ncbi:RagB/SusD family nutrient uptake outer membrane protein [Capnocytophaga canimorsus]|uniref:RagB/SusD family nutrient uptake outer membrane protein n=1 Tax=Capnocytophaga canimorsus TaxID=28188 RepID=UPI00249A3420|nr:RagB/SusD family nutrient uptake outer membrane protein [Capnocytophaga canimorsus]WGU70849.1 RagB/SusD family nutrient uptake outer membrane protein [Capnocytophaga canimorsus]